MNKIILPAKLRDQRGVMLITVLVVGLIVTFVGLSLADLVIAQYRRTAINVFHTNATMTAEAGIERTLRELNLNNDFAGFTTESEFFNNEQQGRGTYQTTVGTGEGNERFIISTGRVYRHSTDGSRLVSTRSIKVTIVGTTSSGYSVYTGVGGLILGGSASIGNSEIFVNGRIEMSGNAKIGTFNNPVNVNVANVACPEGNDPGPTYPQVCNSSDAVYGGTNNEIFGTVCATGQSPSGFIKPGNGGSGLLVGCTAPQIEMPEYDRAAHIAKMEVYGLGNSSTYNCTKGSGERVWPANLSISGNVSLNTSCEIVISGDAYISGDLSIGGNAKITVSESLGETRPVVVVDGSIQVSGSSRVFSNSVGTGIRFISYESKADCGPSCTELSGTPLYQSQQNETIGIRGAVNLPGMVFQSYWGKVYVSGSGNIGAAVGQTVELMGSGNITFGTTLSSGDTTWTIRSYQRNYDGI